MDISEMRVPLQGAVKIFEAGLKSKTWDIHGLPQFITTMHCKGCDMYTLHIVEASKVPMVEINMTNDVRMEENNVSAERDHHQKEDEKLAQSNLRIKELEAKLVDRKSVV